jgi:hypothetical protein
VRSVADRLTSWQRWVLGTGPILLSGLFVVRAVLPVPDPILLSIFVVLAAATAALIAGSRIGAGVVLLLAVALMQPMTAREFAFSLTAIDSDAWFVWAVAATISIGWSIVAAIVVLALGHRSDSAAALPVGAAVAGGVGVGVALIAVFPILAPQPAFGAGLDSGTLDALPVIEMRDFGYDPVIAQATAGERYLARVTNPTALPHTLTIESLDVEVFVPAGRWAVLEIDADDLADAPLAVICTIGDHLVLGMAGVIEVR